LSQQRERPNWKKEAKKYVSKNDKNGDGTLTVDEVTQEGHAKYFETVDADKDGAVNVKEITKWLKECTKAGTCPEVTGEKVGPSEQQLSQQPRSPNWKKEAKKYVKKNDVNGDGTLTVDEVTQEGHAKYFETVDADKDGAVNAEEITKWLKKCTKAGTCPEVTGEARPSEQQFSQKGRVISDSTTSSSSDSE
jgi:Ca2+-binding EF-hand superfamily protein